MLDAALETSVNDAAAILDFGYGFTRNLGGFKEGCSTCLFHTRGHYIDATDVRRIKDLRLCYRHCLGGGCFTKRCRYNHNQITGADLETLKHIAWMTPCGKGKGCNSSGCNYGH